jgi:hypothetical protein
MIDAYGEAYTESDQKASLKRFWSGKELGLPGAQECEVSQLCEGGSLVPTPHCDKIPLLNQ